MASKTCVLVDLNILLDVLQKRIPHFTASARMMSLLEQGKVIGLVSAHSMTTLFYLIQKDQNSTNAKAVITSLLQFLKIAAVNQNTIEQALNLDYADFEDAVQMIAALQNKADYLITRNPRDYKQMLVPVMQPVEFLEMMDGEIKYKG